LWLSIVANLALLGFFKYFDFFAETVNELSGGAIDLPLLYIILPIGISFYTFQSMSYSIDIYRGRARPADRFIDFAQYVSLFPQLVMGPIVRYAQIAEQIRSRDHTIDKATRGAQLFIIGLGKKVLLADTFAIAADAYYLDPLPGLLPSWIGTFAYTMQAYFDFSGYSDMALGLGLMFGYVFPINFNSPFKAHTIAEFWRRWHMSLSYWIRDYLYIPMGGSRVTSRRYTFNIVFAMFIVGLWHGAAWPFIVFGLYQGVALVVQRSWSKHFRMPSVLGTTVTFLFWITSSAIFRSETMADVSVAFSSLFGVHGLGASTPLPEPWLILALAAGGIVVWGLPNSNQLVDRPIGPLRVTGLAALFVVSVGAVFVNDETPFLYYQF
jgi:alginate O-acetyltransferase complex protein AlgI